MTSALEPKATIDPVGAGLCALGIACLVLSMFLPFVSPPAEFPLVVDNTLVHHGGWIFGTIGGLAGIRLLLAYRDGALGRGWRSALGLGAVVACLIALGSIVGSGARQLHSALPTYLADGSMPDTVTAPPGAGLYVALAGGLLLLVGAFAARPRESHRLDAAAPMPVEGWYPNPDDPSELRWWDGARWTGARKAHETPTPDGVA